MIPARIHRIWLGSPIPPEHDETWALWAELFPEHELLTWREDDLERLGLPRAFYEAPTYAEQSDIARLRVVDASGGIYVDCDTEPVRRFDDLWTSTDRLVVVEQEPGLVWNGFIAGAPGALSFVVSLVERNAGRCAIDAAPTVRTGPFAVTAALEHLRSRDPHGVRIYPPSFLDLHGTEQHAIVRTRFRDPAVWPIRDGFEPPVRRRARRDPLLELRLAPLRLRRRIRAHLDRAGGEGHPAPGNDQPL